MRFEELWVEGCRVRVEGLWGETIKVDRDAKHHPGHLPFGFTVWHFGLRVWHLRLCVYGLWFRVWG